MNNTGRWMYFDIFRRSPVRQVIKHHSRSWSISSLVWHVNIDYFRFDGRDGQNRLGQVLYKSLVDMVQQGQNLAMYVRRSRCQ